MTDWATVVHVGLLSTAAFLCVLALVAFIAWRVGKR